MTKTFEEYCKDNQRYVTHLPEETRLPILKRMKQAEDRDIRNKAVDVACFCNGHKRGESSWSRTFTDEELTIKDVCGEDRDESPGNRYTEIWAGKKQVFEAGIWGSASLYIPGTWEQHLDELYEKAQKLEAKTISDEKSKKQKQQADEVAKEKAKWGL